MSAHSRQDIAFFDRRAPQRTRNVLMRFGLRSEAPALSYKILEIILDANQTSRDTHNPTSVPDVSRCRGVDHAEYCLEMTDGRYFRALLYLFNHPISHRFAEPLGGWNRSPWIIFGITNLILTRGE